jgi:hypothetical protein
MECQSALTLANKDAEYNLQCAIKSAKKNERDHFHSLMKTEKQIEKNRICREKIIMEEITTTSIVSNNLAH